MLIQASQPVIVKIIEPAAESTTVADILIGALGFDRRCSPPCYSGPFSAACSSASRSSASATISSPFRIPNRSASSRFPENLLMGLQAVWNQAFRWSAITCVCFQDGGMLSSDLVYVSLNDREKPAVVPAEARGGHEFFGALCDRGYLPEKVWRRAFGDAGGGLHCWPPAN